MKVILLVDVKDVGFKYEIVDVSNGFANNFLFRNKYAVIADNANIALAQKRKEEENAKQKEIRFSILLSDFSKTY